MCIQGFPCLALPQIIKTFFKTQAALIGTRMPVLFWFKMSINFKQLISTVELFSPPVINLYTIFFNYVTADNYRNIKNY